LISAKKNSKSTAIWKNCRIFAKNYDNTNINNQFLETK